MYRIDEVQKKSYKKDIIFPKERTFFCYKNEKFDLPNFHLKTRENKACTTEIALLYVCTFVKGRGHRQRVQEEVRPVIRRKI